MTANGIKQYEPLILNPINSQEIRTIHQDDLIDLSDFGSALTDGESLRVAWLDPESYDYNESTGLLEVKYLDNGAADPVIYRILKISNPNDHSESTGSEIALVNISSDGRISKVNDEIAANGVIAVWRPQSLAHVSLNDGKVITIRSIESVIINPGNLRFLRLAPVIGDPLMIPVDKVNRLTIPYAMTTNMNHGQMLQDRAFSLPLDSDY